MAPCSGQEAEIESVIPAYSVAYAVVADIPRIWDFVKASPSWRPLLLGDETQDIKAAMDEIAGFLGVDLRTLMGIFGVRVAFVQVYMDILNGPEPPAMIADVGDSEDAVEIVRKMEQLINGRDEYEVRSLAGEYKTVPFSFIRLNGGETIVRYAFLDNLLVISPGQDTFEAILDIYLGEDPPLTYDPKFNNTRAEISVDGEIFVYLNMELLWPIIGMAWRSESSKLLQTLGLHEIKSIAWAADLLGTARNQEMYMYTEDGQSLIASLLAEHEPLLSPHLISAVNSNVFLAMNLGDPAAAWEKFMASVRIVLGKEDYTRMQNEIAGFEQETALSLKNDILSSLTGEIGLAMPFPDFTGFEMGEDGETIFFGVKDSALCAMSLERILSGGGRQPQPIGYGGATIYNMFLLNRSGNTVGYTFAHDLLIFGDIQTLESIVDEEPPLAVSENFAEVSSHIPQRPGLMYYMDLAEIGKRMLTADPNIQPEGDVMRLQTLGSIGGTLTHNGEGLKARLVGASGENWLETIGAFVELLVRASL